LPKATLVALTLSVGAAALSCRAKDALAPPALAVNVAVWAVLTDATVAWKLALEAPADTVTVAGTTTALSLLARLTVNPPVVAAAFSVTVQVSVPPPLMELLLQLKALSTGTPVPVNVTRDEVPVEELLVMVNCPVFAPVDVGSNWMLRVAV